MAQEAGQNIYTDQELTINATDLQGHDMDVIDFRVDYWAPKNRSKIPSGTIEAGNITTVPGSAIVIIIVDAGIMEISGTWRFQIIENITNLPWTTMCAIVKNAGAC